MRIIGGHDYYDCGLAYGQDEKVVFVRNAEATMGPKDLRLPKMARMPTIQNCDSKYKWERVDHFYDKNGTRSAYISSVHVVFCGEYFHGIEVDWGLKDQHVFWDLKSLRDYLAKYGLVVKSSEREFEKREFSLPPFSRYKLTGEARDAVMTNRVVVASFLSSDRWNDGYRNFQVNSDSLKQYQFYKVKDAYTAFQEISMFVGGVLPAQGNPMVEISNENKIHKAGFDARSFRHNFKAKPGRKDRRKMEQAK